MNKQLFLIALLVCLFSVAGYSQEKRVLVISGGGARGAWGAGFAKALLAQDHADYRAYFVNSTGSLMAPLLAINNLTTLEHAYTTTEQKDIFNKNPFNSKGDVKMFRAVIRILFGSRNLGETQNLLKLIKKAFTPADWVTLKASGKSVNVAVVSLTKNKLDIKSSDNCSYDDMLQWVWASANQPVFMTAVKKDGEVWVDGGIKENVPITAALKYAKQAGIKNIDVIVNNMQGDRIDTWPPPGKKGKIVAKLLRTIDVFSDEVRTSDILAGVLGAQIDNVTIKVYYMPETDFRLCPQSLFFNPDVLKKLWADGTNYFVRSGALIVPVETKVGNVIIKTYN